MTAGSARSNSTRPWRHTSVLLASLVLLVRPALTGAATQEIDATGRYLLGDNDSKLDGHRLALMEAKRSALEKAGTYVQSLTEVKDLQVTRDEIRTYTAGVLHVEETKEPEWKMVRRNLEVTVYVRVRVDPDDVAKKIGALQKDTDTSQQLKDARIKVEAREKKIVELNRQLKQAKKGSAKAQQAQAARSEAIDDVDSTTLDAQAAVAKKFSIQAYEATKAYMQRQVPAIKGCWRSVTSQAPRERETTLALLGAPPVVLLLCKPRRSRRDPRGRERV